MDFFAHPVRHTLNFRTTLSYNLITVLHKLIDLAMKAANKYASLWKIGRCPRWLKS